MKPLPQITTNVYVTDKGMAIRDKGVLKEVEEAKKELGENGRLLVRQSGTEPLIRITAECETTELCQMYIQRIYEKIKEGGYVNESK